MRGWGPHEGKSPAAVELAERARGIGSGLPKTNLV